MVERVHEFMSNEEKFFEYALKEIMNETSLIHNGFLEEFEKYGFPRKAIKKWIKKEPKKVEILLNHLKPIISLISKIYKIKLSSKNISDWIKTGHVNILKNSISPEIRISFSGEMNYSIRQVHNNNLILGDSIILFKVDGEKRYKTFTDNKDKILIVLLPLCPNRVLIGSVDRIDINYDEICYEIASKSIEFFIASNNNKNILSMQESIGTDAQLLTEEEIRDVVSEIFSK